MKVTVCQLPNESAALEAAWQGLVEHVAGTTSDLVLLPEMPFSPWLAAAPLPEAERWEEAERRHERWLPRLEDLEPAAVVGTRPVREGERRLNRAFVREGGRTRSLHDKFHLPDEAGYHEASWYRRGDGTFEPAEVGGLMLGVLICTEMWFFEHARKYGRAGVRLLLVPRATPRGTLDKWIAGGRSAAVVSGAYCASSNLWEEPGPRASAADLGGRGWLIDPDGGVMALTRTAMPWATMEIDPARADAAKATYPRYVD